MEKQFVRERITQLRIMKKVTERRMSLDLGHSSSYIHSIASGRSMPAMHEFLYICDYLGVTPMEFFNVECNTSPQQQRAIRYIYMLSDKDMELLVGFLERIFEGG